MARAQSPTTSARPAAPSTASGRALRALRRLEPLVEEEPAPAAAPARHRRQERRPARAARSSSLASRRSAEPRRARRLTGIAELDRVLGGGLVPGSALLVGGDPGIGKSTLLLQACAGRRAQRAAAPSTSPARKRSTRSACAPRGSASPTAPVALAAATSVRDILATLEGLPASEMPDAGGRSIRSRPCIVDTLESAPGTVAQVRGAAQELIRLAKRRGIAVVLVGHVTKEGQIAGPRVLEHMVDTVLYFEGERGHQFRILRAVKNRFGPTDEIGVFEMTDGGLAEVANPSALFLGRAATARHRSAGAAVFAGIEGTRPVLVEIQALVAPSALGTPAPRGGRLGSARLAMVMAVLDARCGLRSRATTSISTSPAACASREPAADLAVAAALVSSLADQAAAGGHRRLRRDRPVRRGAAGRPAPKPA